jgi:energy-coupling factor transport system ATP-binding protein
VARPFWKNCAWGTQKLSESKLCKALKSVGLDQLSMETAPHSLSGGQQRRLALAVQLIRKPYLLLLDEPTAGLDWSMRQQIANLLGQLKKNWSLLVVSHDADELQFLADRCWQIDHGRLTPMTKPALTQAGA